MPIIELAYPVLNKSIAADTSAFDKFLKEVVPILVNGLKDFGVIRTLRGFVQTEDGRDVSDDFREVLLIEWPSQSAFENFIVSPAFSSFIGQIKPVITGPPKLKVYETDADAEAFEGHPLIEVLDVRTKASGGNSTEMGKLLRQVSSIVQKPREGRNVTISGMSLNIDPTELVVISSYKDQAALDSARAANNELLAELRAVADVTQLIVGKLVVELASTATN